MKPLFNKAVYAFGILLLLAFMATTGCKKLDAYIVTHNYTPTYLVSDANNPQYMAQRLDPTLINAWGMAVAPDGSFAISSPGSNKGQIYDRTGAEITKPITFYANNKDASGKPTGVVYNSTTDFHDFYTNAPAKFIYTEMDGSIDLWSSGDPSANYLELNQQPQNFNYGSAIAIGNVKGNNYLYVPMYDIQNAKGYIHVLTSGFTDADPSLFNGSFTDPDLPDGYTPFNIRLIDGLLYVTYTKGAGAGLGIINVFNPDGTFIKRFASNGTLNAPWGLAALPDQYKGGSDDILVGNYGDGRINVFDASGNYKGQIMSKGKPLEITGLRALETKVPGADPTQIYFTADLGGDHGLFGYIKRK